MRIGTMALTVFITFFCILNVSSQVRIDTIDVGKGFKPVVVFPDNIAESILGDDLYFDVELSQRDGSQYSGRIIKLSYNEASREREDFTNYTVITENGNMYNFVLRLVKSPNLVPKIITPNMATTNITGSSIVGVANNSPLIDGGISVPFKKDSLKVVDSPVNYYSKDDTAKSFNGIVNKGKLPELTDSLYKKNVDDYYKTRSFLLKDTNNKIISYFSRSGDVFLWLKGIYYDHDELYFVFKLENNEGVDYKVNLIKFFIETKRPVSAAEHRSVYEYEVPKIVAGKDNNNFVVVFKTFSLSKKRTLKVELDEFHGNRNISLKIDHRIINNPIRL